MPIARRPPTGKIDELLPAERTPADYQRLVDDPRADQETLLALARSPYSFVRSAVADSPRADASTLAAIPLDDLPRWTRNHILAATARHPNADRPTLLRTLRAVAESLDRPGERPYAAALSLALRPELTPAEILTLTARRNASARMIKGVRRALSCRPDHAHHAG
ncbi:hypothetical protein [Actinoplanes subglobosus]|uniref:Uncharacterized protein n=1 Tax=Actinoplanes subglobosus TaxID=1547892 RepID=A0ABV8INW2_9ACTN